MIRNRRGEIWKQVIFPGHKQLRKKYAVSNFGRVASYINELNEDGKVLKGSATAGYRTLNLHIDEGNDTIYIHREVAHLFCYRKSKQHSFIIHLNYRKADNHFTNLCWVTKEEAIQHQQRSPDRLAYKQRRTILNSTAKLTASQVKKIRKALNEPTKKNFGSRSCT